MIQTLQARNVTLRDLIEKFQMQLVQDEQFFPEWQNGLPDLSDFEKQFLDKVKAGYFNLVTDPPVLEKPVQLAIVAPILFLADFYLPPFQIKAETSIEISEEDEGVIIRGSLDVLVLKEQLWLLVIESKQASFSLEVGLAQLLAYMMASPNPTQPSFGLLTNGGSFTFVKLVKNQVYQYATSRFFELRNPGNELYDVLKILKRISQL
jgi:hypothetical protein